MDYRTKAINCVKDTALPVQMHLFKECNNDLDTYRPLWEYVQSNGGNSLKLTFEEIQSIVGKPIDHSFLKYKRELTEYGYEVGKISMKEQTVFLIE